MDKEVEFKEIWTENAADRVTLSREGFPTGYFEAGYRYWIDCRPPGGLPSVDMIDPLKLPKACLPRIDLVAVEKNPIRFQIRLWGTGIVNIVGSDFSHA